MSKIIVSSYDKAADAYRTYQPAYVVSILGADDGPRHGFDGLARERLIELRGDCSNLDASNRGCRALIELARRWDRAAPILIHCQEGVARSMAAAYILLCAAQSDRCEHELAKKLRQAAPHADPNLLLISQADHLLGRDDRMVEAVLDLCPCAGVVCDDVVILPLAS